MTWVLIRHGMTQGNLEGRYIGCRTDEPLCPAGKAALLEKRYPRVHRVFSSPMRRCLETADLIYPGVPVEIVPDFRECDFGLFENRNYAELNGRADYQAWIDSGGTLPFPGGEGRDDFVVRCCRAFREICERGREEDCAIVAHGGTVMAIMEAWGRPKLDYYDYQILCGEGYIMNLDGIYMPLI